MLNIESENAINIDVRRYSVRLVCYCGVMAIVYVESWSDRIVVFIERDFMGCFSEKYE